MAIKRVAGEVRAAALLRVAWRSKLTRPMDTASRAKWKEVSSVVEELGSLLKDKKSTRQKKSCKERVRRKQQVLVVAEELANRRKIDDSTRSIIIRGFTHLNKIREEEEVAKELLEEVQDSQQHSNDEVLREIENYLASWDETTRRCAICRTAQQASVQ